MMKHNHPINMLLSIFAVLLVGMSVLYVAGREMTFYKQSASQKSILNGVEGISNATMFVAEHFSDIVREESEEKYNSYKKMTENPDRLIVKESDLRRMYLEGVVSGFLQRVGGKDNLAEYITKILPAPSSGTLKLDENTTPYLYVKRDESGHIVTASVRDVVFVYEGIPGVRRTEKMRFDLLIPDVIFYGGDEELFDFAMIAGKGIYATGATSSFVGNIYAGSHNAMESRELEVAYGEIGSYGGLNFLSTQVGIASHRIISEADINLNGSFVIFNPEDTDSDPLICYAGKIRKMRGYNQDSMYSVAGEVYQREAMPEGQISDYMRYKQLVENSLAGIYEIPFYYDSNNDENYEDEYRKIISSEDVEIKEDFTGIVFTPGTVIIGAGCNVEGLIMCGDRIYLQGNNNIVCNADVVKKIIAKELFDEGADNKEQDTPEYDSQNENQSGIIYHAVDYIGGFSIPGIKNQHICAIPYQE